MGNSSDYYLAVKETIVTWDISGGGATAFINFDITRIMPETTEALLNAKQLY